MSAAPTRDPPRFTPDAIGVPALDAAFERDGLAIVEGFVSGGACETLIARGRALAESSGDSALASVFSTHSHAHAADRYFEESGDKIRIFLEEGAAGAEGELARPLARSVNKIGHALHDLDDAFSRFSRDARLGPLLRRLGLAEPLLLQSMLIFKPPRIGGEVVWHQDATFLYTEPSSVIGLWWALEDATVHNGCLLATPGAHRGPLRRRFRRRGGRLGFEELDETPLPVDGAVALEVPRGTLVLLHGKLPHASAANRSSRSRAAYSVHVVDGRCRYPADNWLQRDNLPLRGFDD